MNGDADFKPLPSPGRDEKLPPLPPPEDPSMLAPPAPPRKVVQNQDPNDLSTPPMTPLSPQSSMDSKPKKVNPLSDLIDTEKAYVELLTGIIRKVASAWSRSNLPPPELDTMFRSIEAIHKANRQLLANLKEIGTNPSSPKALGDLLMKWIEDFDAPYSAYSSRFICGFDTWQPIQSNDRLRTVLAMFSSSTPPPLPAASPEHPAEPPIWTLDELFILPKNRLKYYRKLYTRLLKSTTPGRSDHRVLTGALERLDRLISTVDERAEVRVVNSPSLVQSPVQMSAEAEDEVVIDMRSRASAQPLQSAVPPFATAENRASGGTQGSSDSGGRRSSDTAPTSVDRSSVSTMSSPVSDLERRLSTERTLDIFTMQPKQVRLQMNPPTLTYTREIKFSVDVVMSVTPRSTGTEMVHERGHVFLLTDLLLVCERKTPGERARSQDESDMWLLYPPLAGKHLRVAPLPNSDTAMAVTIMRKETLVLYAQSPSLRDRLMAEFHECIDTATQLFPASKAAPPPVPPLPPMNGMQTQHSFSAQPSPGHQSPPERSLSPPSRSLSPNGRGEQRMDGSIVNNLERLALHHDYPQHGPPYGPPQGPQQGPPYGPNGQAYPARSASMAEGGPSQLHRAPSFGPGEVIPSQQQYPQLPMPQSFSPGQVMPPQQPHRGMNGGGPMSPGGGPMSPGGPMHPGAGPMHPGELARGPSGAGRGGPPMQYPERSNSIPASYGPGGPQHGQPTPGGDPNYRPSGAEGGFHPGRGGPPGPGRGGPPGGLPGRPSPYGPPQPQHPRSRPPSDSSQSGLRHSSSSHSLGQHRHQPHSAPPPMPGYPGDLAPPRPNFVIPRNSSTSSLYSLPSSLYREPAGGNSSVRSDSTGFALDEPSPPSSPVAEEPPPLGPTTSTISAQMKCKVFLQQQHAQWKSLGAAKLKLYRESPTNVKQLVVEADNKSSAVLISTLVLVDGVERVGKTGVAVELSDKGRRTGIIYMIQLRNEGSAQGLFDSLLAGSDRFAAHARG